jgi:hypothetical protein
MVGKEDRHHVLEGSQVSLVCPSDDVSMRVKPLWWL